MSGETEQNVSGWTTDTLSALVERLLAERDERYAARFQGAHLERKRLRQIMETRFNGMDRANDVLAATVNRVPTDVDRQVGQLKAVHDEHFLSVEAAITDLAASMVVRFQERDTRSEREARDNKIAVDAAFAAAKEAVAENNKSSALANDKSEASFTKQIDALGSAVDSKFKATDDKIDDIKGQLSNRTGRDMGSLDTRTFVFALCGLILAVITAAALIGAHL